MSSEFLLRARKFSESVLVSETHQTLDEKKKKDMEKLKTYGSYPENIKHKLIVLGFIYYKQTTQNNNWV
jgi:hypothetical protein